MAKKKEEGGYSPQRDICPQCGYGAGIGETITSLSKSGTKQARRELLGEVREDGEKREMMLEAEGRSDDVCPRCGFGGGATGTITDQPPANIKEAHRQLKAEIKEIREKKKKGEA